MIRLAAAIVALIAPVPVCAQQQEPAAPSEAPGQPEDDQATDRQIVVEGEKPKRICQARIGTGSIISRRVCRTSEQIAAEEERARAVKERLSSEQEAAQHTAELHANR